MRIFIFELTEPIFNGKLSRQVPGVIPKIPTLRNPQFQLSLNHLFSTFKNDVNNIFQEIEAAFKRDNGELTNRISHFLLKGMRSKATGLIKS